MLRQVYTVLIVAIAAMALRKFAFSGRVVSASTRIRSSMPFGHFSTIEKDIGSPIKLRDFRRVVPAETRWRC